MEERLYLISFKLMHVNRSSRFSLISKGYEKTTVNQLVSRCNERLRISGFDVSSIFILGQVLLWTGFSINLSFSSMRFIRTLLGLNMSILVFLLLFFSFTSLHPLFLISSYSMHISIVIHFISN